MTHRIALVGGNYLNRDTWQIVLASPSRTFDAFEHAQTAIPILAHQPYGLILIDPHMAPGLECRDPKIAEIMDLPHRRARALGLSTGYQNPDYFAVGLRVIELTRQGDANRDTPIVVVTLYDPKDCVLHPNAERDSFRAGATEYMCLFTENLDALEDVIQRHLGRKLAAK